MEETNKMNQTPEETAQALSELAEKLAEMDQAEGKFGEVEANALPDEYLEEVAGGIPAVVITSAGATKHIKECISCHNVFSTYDFNQEICNTCLNPPDRP